MRRYTTVPGIKTIVQSFDTARYHQDTVHDQKIDIAHARTEALLALLFGRTIVVPAGQVAESPAFISLFCEIMDSQKRVRSAIYSNSTFRPFSLALEEKYRNYDEFVADYSETAAFNPELEKQAQDGQRSKSEQLALMRKAYLARDYASLEKGQVGYGHFANLVATEFGSDSESGSKPVIANGQKLYTGQVNGLGRAILDHIASAADRGVSEEILASLKEATKAILADIEQSGSDPTIDGPNLRGSW